MPFQVLSSQSASVAGTSSRTALTANNGEVLYLYVPSGGANISVKFGDISVTAAVTDFVILNGTSHTLVVPATATHIAHIGDAAGPTTLYFHRGHWY